MIALLLWIQQDIEETLRRRPTVEMAVGQERPLKTLLAEISRQSGMEFEVDPRLADTRVTLQRGKLGAFEAVHEVLKAHGGARLLFATFSKSVQVVPASPSTMPWNDSGPFHHLLTHVQLTRSHSFDRSPERRLTITLWLAWTPVGAPASLSPVAVVTEANDDTGQSLLEKHGPLPKEERLLGKPICAQVATVRLAYPNGGAKRIRSLKGYREATFIAETRPVRIEGLEQLPSSSKGGELTVTKLKRGARGLSAVLEGPRPEGEFTMPDHHQGLSFVDDRGGRYPVRITTSAVAVDRVTVEVLATDIPENAKIVACESKFVVRWKNWKIPFEFADVELP